jgi:hypothetical protein
MGTLKSLGYSYDNMQRRTGIFTADSRGILKQKRNRPFLLHSRHPVLCRSRRSTPPFTVWKASLHRTFTISVTASKKTGSVRRQSFFELSFVTKPHGANHQLYELSNKVSISLMNEAKTDESGLYAYFDFRSMSEQAKLKDPAWA